MIRLILQRRRALGLFVCALLVAQTILPAGIVYSQDGANVVAGGASIAQDGSTLNVTTQSDRTIINWNSFSIDAGQTANFLQPNAQSTVLNRVITANNPSMIYGNLNSNGNVILVNPSGILVGPSGVINTNGFIGSVHDIPDLEFLEGGPLHFRGDSTASVINQGTITTGAGGVGLIGGDVINEGTITSYGGSISLVTGGSVTLADGSRFTHADLGTIEMGLSPYAGVIQNSGTIRATGALESGGEVYLVNPGGKIMHDGTIAALKEMNDGTTSGGSVVLDSTQGGETTVAGDIDVTGDTGGSVIVEADHIALAGADIDASGTVGGGNINLGGGFMGNDPSIANARTTSVDASSSLRADAFDFGDGGEIIIYSNDSTVYSGFASATGGMLGGNGGLIEVSSDYVFVNGTVELGSVIGQGGTFLIDPTNACLAFDVATCPPGESFIDIDDTIIPALNLGGVIVTVSTLSTGTQDGDIHVLDPIATTTTTSSTLALNAHDDIVIDAAISDAGNGLDLEFFADTDSTGGGEININASIVTNNGDISLLADDWAIGSTINAGTGSVLIDRVTPGPTGLGFDSGAIPTLNVAELGRITADSLIIGDSNAADNNLTRIGVQGNFDLSTNVSELVQLNALNGSGSFITTSRTQTYPSVEFNTNDGVTFTRDQSLTTTVGDVIFNVDADGTGVVGDFDDLRTQGGIVVIESAADISVIAPAYTETAGGTITLNANMGAGTINFQRSVAGTIGVGSGASGGLSFSDGQLGRLTADTINFGDPTTPNLTTAINVNAVDLTSISDVNFYTAGTTTFSGSNSFDSISTNGGITSVGTSASLLASDELAFNTTTANLDGNIAATNGISGLATVVNVLGSTGGAELQDAVDVAVAGATINVAAGSYSEFVIDKANLLVDGVGAMSIVNASSPAITIDANGVTVQDLLLQGTGSANEVGILLDGTSSPDLTGISIVNVDMSNLDQGVVSQGDIGTGVAADVSILGTSAADPAILEDFLGSAIVLGDTDGDAIYVIQDLTVRDGSTDADVVGTGVDGMQFGAIGGVTIQRVDISGATGDGIQFGILDDAVVNVLDSSIVGAIDTNGVANGIFFSRAISNGSQVTVAGNSQIVSNGGLHGIDFDGAISGSTTLIDIANNTLIRGVENSGIVIGRDVTDASFIVRGNGTDTSNGIVGFGDAFTMNRGNISFTNANVLIGGDSTSDGNFISSQISQSIDVEQISGGTFTVANNTLRTTNNNVLNIEFEQTITNGATVQLINNSDISGGAFGVGFLGDISESEVILAGNNITATNQIFADAIRFAVSSQVTDSNVTIGSANVMVDGTAIAAGGNTLSSGGNGINVRGPVNGDTNFVISDNSIGTSISPVGINGIDFEGGILDTATVTIGGSNQVFAASTAINIEDLQSPSTLSITGGSYTATGGALLVDNRGVPGSDGRLEIGAAAFSVGAGGAAIDVRTNAGNAGVDIDFNGAATIDGGTTGLRLVGPGIDILNDSLGNIAFTNQTTNYIELVNGAEFLPGSPTIIDASNVTFDGLTGLGMTPAQLLATEDMIVHFPDNNTLGLIDISPLFVVQGESIQTAVNFAGTLVGPQTVFVGNGTFGGSVEVWVDDLTLLGNGATTLIDTDAVDPFANNGDVNNGFQIVARSQLSGFGNVSGVTIDGFSFDTLSSNNGNTGIVLGIVGFPFSNASDATLQNLVINDVRDGIVANRVTDSTTITNVTMTDISQQGIDFILPLAADDTILIEDSNISSRLQSIRFLSFVAGSDIDVAGNTLNSTFSDAIRFVGPVVDADVLIGGLSPADSNQIVGGNDGIDISNISDGSFIVANNALIQGAGDGIKVRGSVGLANLGIVGNTEIRGGDEGIILGGAVFNSLVSISGNTGIFGDGRDAIRFASPITTSGVMIGPSLVNVGGSLTFFGGNTEIAGADDGINLDQIGFAGVSIISNSTIRGTAGSGIEFDDSLQNGLVLVSANETIRGGEFGVEFDTTIDDSIVAIQANTEIIGDTLDGIRFDDAIDNSQIVIGSAVAALGNGTITGGFDGIEFEGAITGGNTTIRVVNNDSINGGRGVVFDNTINDALVVVRANDVTANTIDAILFDETITDANVIIAANQLTATSGEGIDIANIDGGNFIVAFNTIEAAFDGIEFEADITSDAFVNVVSNEISAGGVGIHFDVGSSVVDDAIVNLVNNDITVSGGGSSGILVRNLGSSNPLSIVGGSVEGGLFGINVIQQDGTGLNGSVVLDSVVVNSALGAGLIFTNENAIDTLDVTLQNAVTINGGASSMDKGIVFDGLGLSLAGDTFNDTQLLGINGNFIELRNGALFEPGQPTFLDATGVNFDGLDPTVEDEFTEITLRIIDFLDDPTLGLIFPGAPDLNPNLTYDRYTRYEDYFRTVNSLLGPNAGTIRYRAPIIDVAEELQP